MKYRPLKDLLDNSRRLYEQRELEEIAARWSAKAATWDLNLQDPDCHLNEDDAYNRFLAHLLRVINQRQKYCSEHGVIDAGCATGLVLAKAIPHFAWGMGVDISAEMIEAARSKRIPKATFVLGDCFEFGKLGTKAGAVISRGVLLSHYGLTQAIAMLQGFRSALLPGGFLLCDFLNEGGRERYKHLSENKTYFFAADVLDLATQAGFRTAEVLGEPERRVQLLLAE